MESKKMIHMTYKAPIPRVVYNRWQQLNPDYDIYLSLDPECIYFLKTHFNEYISNLFHKIKKGMYKADLWRLCKLFHHGGVYADVDLVPYITIDEMSPNVFYSCLAADKVSIFQAFMINHASKSPFILCLLLSLLIHHPYHIPNGPCHDMAKCIMYMLNVVELKPYTLYTVDKVKVKIPIGASRTPTKYIGIHYFPPGMKYTLKIVGNTTTRFQLNIVDTTLVVTRIDKFDGWNTFYYVEICFDHSQQIYLFEEFVPPQGMAYAYVMDKDKKILDSRDINYYKYGGW